MFFESKPMILLLLGTSGVGKTSVLEYLQTTYSFDSAKKYTTRKPRNSVSDEKNFIFCNTIDEFPKNKLLVFQNYGDAFGIQIEQIELSIKQGRNHVLIIGDAETAIKLKNIFPEQIKVVLLYCDYDILKSRIMCDTGRLSRWKTIEREIQGIYSWLGVVDYILDCSKQFDITKTEIDKLIQRINLCSHFDK